MVKPSQPKGIKPKAEISESIGEVSGGDFGGKKLIIVNAVITVLICFLFIGSNFLIVQGVVNKAVSHIATNPDGEAEGEEGAAEGEETAPERGIILDLGEFILNLSDPNSKRYLKVNVALELSRAETDPPLEEKHGGSGSAGHGGSGNAGAAKVDPLAEIQKEMEQYKPAIRDAVISVLSSKTSEELASLSGKELAKEQIKAAVDPLFGGEREVLRVSFGTFIIQ
jgi:flagellar FliL protein